MDRCQFQRVETVDQVESLKIGTSQGFFSCAAGKKEAGFKGRGRCKHLPICVVGHQKVLGYSTRWIHGLLAHDGTRIYQDNQALGCSADLHHLGPIPSPKTSRRTSFWRPASARAAPGRSISKDGLDRSGVLSNHSQICWDPRCMLSVNSSRLAWVTWLHSFPPLFISSGNVVQMLSAWGSVDEQEGLDPTCHRAHACGQHAWLLQSLHTPWWDFAWVWDWISRRTWNTAQLYCSRKTFKQFHAQGASSLFSRWLFHRRSTLRWEKAFGAETLPQSQPPDRSYISIIWRALALWEKLEKERVGEDGVFVSWFLGGMCAQSTYIYIYTSLSLSIYIYIHIRVYIYVYVFIYIYIDISISISISIYIYTHTYIYIYLSLSIYIYLSLYIYISLSLYIYAISLSIYLYLYLYLYIYIHTYIYISLSIYIYISLSLYIYIRHIFALMLLGQPIAPLLSFRFLRADM